jgi:regulator of RNase E activity RraA
LTTNSLSNATLKKLGQFDTPTICNVIELFDVRPYTAGYMNERIRAAFPEMAPMVGFAATATFRAGAPPSKNIYTSLEGQVEQFATLPGPAVVVFQDLDEPSIGATFGDVMCSTYQAFGAAGLVTSGGGRDLLQVKALGFPVFTGATICSHAYCQTVKIGMPVRVGGLTVSMGDLLHGDANGVTSIPFEIAAEVADVAAEFLAAEAHVIEYAKSPGPKCAAQLAARRAAMGDAVAMLRQRVSRKST